MINIGRGLGHRVKQMIELKIQCNQNAKVNVLLLQTNVQWVVVAKLAIKI